MGTTLPARRARSPRTGRTKTGAVVACPKCGAELVVPEPAAKAPVMKDIPPSAIAPATMRRAAAVSGSSITIRDLTLNGVALNDSPAGLLAWIAEKFHGWSVMSDKQAAIDAFKQASDAAKFMLTHRMTSVQTGPEGVPVSVLLDFFVQALFDLRILDDCFDNQIAALELCQVVVEVAY